MGIPALDAPTELTKHEITKTPLWYYCLQEAASHKGKLGSVGGTIVATVILRLLHLDAESIFCPKHDFTPWNGLGATQGGKYTIGHMLQFVEKNRDNIVNADGLDIREQLYTLLSRILGMISSTPSRFPHWFLDGVSFNGSALLYALISSRNLAKGTLSER